MWSEFRKGDNIEITKCTIHRTNLWLLVNRSIVYYLVIHETEKGGVTFMCKCMSFSYRQLLAIIKEDNETFGFEIQVRL